MNLLFLVFENEISLGSFKTLHIWTKTLNLRWESREEMVKCLIRIRVLHGRITKTLNPLQYDINLIWHAIYISFDVSYIPDCSLKYIVLQDGTVVVLVRMIEGGPPLIIMKRRSKVERWLGELVVNQWEWKRVCSIHLCRFDFIKKKVECLWPWRDLGPVH